MKKLLLIMTAVAGALSAYSANERLCIYTDYEVYANWDAVDTHITVGDNTITVAPGSDSELTLPLADVKAIGYSTNSGVTTFVNTNIANMSGVEVYGTNGISYGKYESAQEAVKALPTGVYVLKGDGITVKIHVR